MKKIIISAIFSFSLLLFSEMVNAQIVGKDQQPQRDTILRKNNPGTQRRADTLYPTQKDTSRMLRKIDTAARNVARKGTELGAKAVAGIRDCSLKNVKGPKGETVYVDEYDRRYYINKEGKKAYLKRPPVKTGQ